MTKTEEKAFIPLYVDLQFKNLFGTTKNKKYTCDLLENLFGLKKGSLKNLKILNSVKLDNETIINKRFELDVLIELPNGSKINMEMQKVLDKSSTIKNIMYVFNVFSTNLKAGQNYNETKPVLQVDFIKDNHLYDSDDAIQKFALLNLNDPNNVLLGNLFSIIMISIDKKKKISYTSDKKKGFEVWRRFMGAETLKEAEKIASGNPMLEEKRY